MAGLHHLLLASTERNPSQPVFVRDDQVCTYAELEHASGRFASGLRDAGVAKGDRVALVLDGQVDFLIAYYGIARAGAVVVPLCPDTRSGPLVHGLAASGARAAILDAGNVKYLAGQSAQLPQLRAVIHKGQLGAGAQGQGQAFRMIAFEDLLRSTGAVPEDAVSSDDLLSITYTSGTTGRPKGVMLSHRNLMANVRSIVQYLALGAHDRAAMVLPFYYVYGNSVLHTHVMAGATVVHAGTMTFPAQVLKTIAGQRCTGLSGVPTTFARLLGLASLADYDLASLRYLTQAGAGMPPALTQRVLAAFPRARLFVMYGQTEAAARLSYVPPEDLPRKLGSVGKAIPGVEINVVGADGRVVGAGETGEIVARGENIMIGYWEDAAETGRVLREDGLHTGDLARIDEEGFLFIVGRETEMIKSGAHRISPREIEEVVERVPGVRECAAVGLPDEVMGQLIAVFVVTNDGEALDPKMILRACLTDLPRFKIPERVFFVPELPRTPTGKLRRAQLVAAHVAQDPARP